MKDGDGKERRKEAQDPGILYAEKKQEGSKYGIIRLTMLTDSLR